MGLAIAGVLVLSWFLNGSSGDPSDDARPEDPPTLYVSEFDVALDSREHESFARSTYEQLLLRLGNQNIVTARRAQIQIDDKSRYARDAGADFLLEGALFEDSSTTRLALELFSSKLDTTFLLYENEFVRYDLQEDLSTVVERLSVAVDLVREWDTIARGTTNPGAYLEYVLGLNLLKQREYYLLFSAERNFRRAVALDSTFSESYAALSLTMALTVSTGYALSYEPSSERFEDARRTAIRAIDLDSSNASAHAALAYVIHERDWDWDAARARFETALDLNRDDASILHLFATHLAELGDLDQALRFQRRAVELEPDEPVYHASYARVLFLRRNYSEALYYLNDHSDVVGDFFLAGVWRTLCLLELDKVEEARSALNLADGNQPTLNPLMLAIRGMVFARYNKDNIFYPIRDIEHMNVPVLVATLYAEIGEYERALDYLERGLETRDVYMTYLKVWPYFDPLREMPRFQQIMQYMDLD